MGSRVYNRAQGAGSTTEHGEQGLQQSMGSRVYYRALGSRSMNQCEDISGSGLDDDEDSGAEAERSERTGSTNGLGGPRELPLRPLHSWRDSCNEEHLSELRAKCQMLIQHCIAGLVLNLTLEQVRDVEAALQRSVCWYLTCERYWEAANVDHLAFPWSLVTGAVLLLTLGVSLAYYLVWGLAEPHESVPSPPSSTASHPYLTSSSPYPNYLTAPPTHPTNHNTPMPPNSLPPHTSSHYLLGRPHPPTQSSPAPGYTSYSVMSGSSRRRKLWAGNESESECRDSGFTDGESESESGFTDGESESESGYTDGESESESGFTDGESESESGFTDGPLGSDLSAEELSSYDQQSRARHYSADSRPPSSAGGAPAVAADESGRIEDRQFNYASSFTPNYEHRRLRRNRYNYLDDFDSYSEMDGDQTDSASLSRERSDSFIYVAYPPEVKKRFHQDQR
ncbi:hypothetical protein FHG87_006366 [Trinorchestia longiramus]|nr:hypothetical protein FHG87_006366 [Trinorchestia longiramus]